ncbi:polysaccharide deacetylase family protein [Clostridium sp. B9]|uniref:polysaccharide deacetylase family protein n=1 Tax=Clostridium sp. B9 TaxID=3423224 RepID=UPI003D2EEDE1
MKRYKKVLIALTTLICMGALVGCGSSKTVQANAEESVSVAKGDDVTNNKEMEKKESDSSGVKYLALKDDPNAEDAKVVSEHTNGLLKGTLKYPVRTDGKKVAYLTFDDGPSTTNTQNVLDVLDKYGVKGTFFVMGKSIEKNEESKNLLKEIAEKGHAIGNHSYSHDYRYLYPNRSMNVSNIMDEFNKTNEAMKSVLGEDFNTKVVRFPGGYWSWKDRTPMKEKMVETGIENIDWNALNGDAEGKKKNADELYNYFVNSVELLGDKADSVVVLMHDTYGKEETVKSLPKIIEYLKGKGFEFKSIKSA